MIPSVLLRPVSVRMLVTFAAIGTSALITTKTGELGGLVKEKSSCWMRVNTKGALIAVLGKPTRSRLIAPGPTTLVVWNTTPFRRMSMGPDDSKVTLRFKVLNWVK